MIYFLVYKELFKLKITTKKIYSFTLSLQRAILDDFFYLTYYRRNKNA